ncbi:MAG: nitroreductase family deazaflavin-dependent oxidoreductase [bacterium]|nr:nitroreductase family deazaflavin-dependent oxidoreductase [bacterium]
MAIYPAVVRWIGDKPWFRPVATHVLPRVDTVLLRSRGWRSTPFPTLLLTTVGHRSGRPHHAPLYYLDDEGFVVIASNYGRNEPDWSRNLREKPTCQVKVGRSVAPALATQVADTARPHYLERFAAFYPPYRDYVARAGREIPIWMLAPLPAAP